MSRQDVTSPELFALLDEAIESFSLPRDYHSQAN